MNIGLSLNPVAVILKRKFACGTDTDSDSNSDSDSDSDRNSDSDDDRVPVVPLAMQVQKMYLLIKLPDILALEGSNLLPIVSVRRGNMHRNRDLIIQWSNLIDDVMFTRQFRLCRADFFYVCSAMYPTGTCTSPLTNSSTAIWLSG